MNERVLVACGRKPTADKMARALEGEGFTVVLAENGKETCDMISSLRPDIMILDETIPEHGGREVLTSLGAGRGMGIIMLTYGNDVQERIKNLELGADDCIPEACDSRELLAKTKTLLRLTSRQRENPPDGGTVRFGGIEIRVEEHRVTAGKTAVTLTPKEFDLLKLLLSNPNRVFSRKQLLKEVWGISYFGGTRTVDIHIQRLRKKLGREYQCVLKTVHGVGYRAFSG